MVKYVKEHKVFKTNAWWIVFTVVKIIINHQIKDEINEWEKIWMSQLVRLVLLFYLQKNKLEASMVPITFSLSPSFSEIQTV